MNLDIQHLADRHRFQAVVDGHTSFSEYRQADGVISIVHTEVPPELGGRGIAGALVKAVLEHAKATGQKVKTLCSYATSYLERHPEYAPLLA
jgi:predicted GNAT family acetyltransferase